VCGFGSTFSSSTLPPQSSGIRYQNKSCLRMSSKG
jgi:hypothetical protein